MSVIPFNAVALTVTAPAFVPIRRPVLEILALPPCVVNVTVHFTYLLVGLPPDALVNAAAI